MEQQLELIQEKMEKLRIRKKILKDEEKELNAEYKRLTNQFYELMLEKLGTQEKESAPSKMEAEVKTTQ